MPKRQAPRPSSAPKDNAVADLSTDIPPTRPVQPVAELTAAPVAKTVGKWLGWFAFVAIVLIAVGVIKYLHNGGKQGTAPVATIQILYPPVDFSGTTVVEDTTFVWMPQWPFFQTAPVTLQPGDEVEIIPAGSYGFDRFYRGMGNDDTVMLPGSYPKTPNQRGGIKKVKEFPLKDEPMGGILCGFGKVVNDENHIPRMQLEGSQLIFCGRGAIVRVPNVADPKMQLTLNERWFAYSWDDNCGKIYIRVIVHRKTS